MSEQPTYAKLKDLTEFTIQSYEGYEWFQWDPTTSTPRKSNEYFDGAQKKHNLLTDAGLLSLSEAQMGQVLLSAFETEGALSSPVGKSFVVKNNGEEGKDIRYFINRKGIPATVKHEAPQQTPPPTQEEVQAANPTMDRQDEEISIDKIPF